MLKAGCVSLSHLTGSGEVAPDSYIPAIAKEWQALIIENNLEPTCLTYSLTDHFLQGKVAEAWPIILAKLNILR